MILIRLRCSKSLNAHGRCWFKSRQVQGRWVCVCLAGVWLSVATGGVVQSAGMSGSGGMPDVGVEAVFREPFSEQVAFFRKKLGSLVPTERWDDLWKEQHDRSFMVAGAQKADLLADLAAAVDAAISNGESLRSFRDRFDEIVDLHGWTGWTGEGSRAGRDWRTRVIYQTNLATSYAAGRLSQLRAGGFSHWMYKHSDAVAQPRPHHVALDGVVEPADSPFWQRYFPPNGWGCHCRVVGVRDADSARRLGGDFGRRAPGWTLETDPRTGEAPGVDRGWGYVPGASVADALRSLSGKLNKLPERPSVALIQDWVKSEAFARWFESPTGSWPLVRMPEADAMALGAADGVRVAQLSSDTVTKQKMNHPELTSEEYDQAQSVVDGATVKDVQDNIDAIGRKTGTKSMVYVRKDESRGHVMVVKATQSGEGLWVTSYRRLSGDKALSDAEISRLLRSATRKE